MLRAMGMGAALDAAKKLAESGAVEKIIEFADGLPELRARLARIERYLMPYPDASNGGPGDGSVRVTIQGTSEPDANLGREPGTIVGSHNASDDGPKGDV